MGLLDRRIKCRAHCVATFTLNLWQNSTNVE